MTSPAARAATARGPRRRLPPPGLAARYEAGASLRELACSYHMSVRTVRALLVAAGVRIRPPGRRTRTGSAGTSTATGGLPPRKRAMKPASATVHPLHPGAPEPHLAADVSMWPSIDVDVPRRPWTPPPLARATPGQPCVGFTTPDLIHTIDDRPVPTWTGQYTAAMTRCARVGLVDAPVPSGALPCPDCAPTLAPAPAPSLARAAGDRPELPEVHGRQHSRPPTVEAP
ncbi:helix-turn-helix domain-containing protein [Amycolatopsis sp. PS_44_ISF1]|uniref:helix-turn-helix domain-containing protein n=1 Tax=Amycolatopsis sp. PS_44_ISF1 TaxID=2974917 RepID=UPI0037C0C34C